MREKKQNSLNEIQNKWGTKQKSAEQWKKQKKRKWVDKETEGKRERG